MAGELYKAQWPLSTTEAVPTVLIYECNEHGGCIGPHNFLAATAEVRTALFDNKHIRVFFRGLIYDGNCEVNEFVKQEDWL